MSALPTAPAADGTPGPLRQAPFTPTLIVGAGPAGLAVAACLRRLWLPFEIIEQTGEVGHSWMRHYERLHLHTDKAHSELPYLPFPRDYPRYPSRQQVVDYLQDYARHFQITPRFHEQVVSARCVSSGEGTQSGQPCWEVDTHDTRYRTHHLVLATGVNHDPHLPHWPGQDQYKGEIVHSAHYKNGARWAGKQVLVVGLGNSGGEIAIDLWEHQAKPSLAVRSPVNVIPREVMGTPFLTVGVLQRSWPAWLADAVNAPTTRLLVGDLTRYGLPRPRLGPVAQVRQEGKVPFIDIGTIDLVKRGEVGVYPGIEHFTPEGVVFTDGRSKAFDAIVLATGYRSQAGHWLEDGRIPLPDKQVPSPQPGLPEGLHLCGFYVSPTGMLREIAREAKLISRVIAASDHAQASAAR